MRHYTGQALPGGEDRASTLDYGEIIGVLGQRVHVGTFNVDLVDDLYPGEPDLESDHYQFWRCWVSTAGMIEREEPGIAGWLIRVRGEDLPAHFVEVLSVDHIRTLLKKANWPAFPIEISL